MIIRQHELSRDKLTPQITLGVLSLRSGQRIKAISDTKEGAKDLFKMIIFKLKKSLGYTPKTHFNLIDRKPE